MRSITVLVLLMFGCWLLPLGGFVKSGQKEATCGGQRAICLCATFVKAKTANGPGKVLSAPAADPAKNTRPAGSGNEFLPASPLCLNGPAAQPRLIPPVRLPAMRIALPIDHVPKI